MDASGAPQRLWREVDAGAERWAGREDGLLYHARAAGGGIGPKG
jgi:hypothetical protein